jgi:hypothetical protein
VCYGTEQAFAGPEKSERDQFLPDYDTGNPPPDKYLREAIFGPEHPRKSGAAGIGSGASAFDLALPGFGAFGTVGAHCFDPNSAAFVRIRSLIAARKQFLCCATAACIRGPCRCSASRSRSQRPAS